MSAIPQDSIGAQSIPTPSLPPRNIQRNGIPGESELIRLEVLADINARIMEILDGEIGQLQAAHDILHSHRTDLETELEVTQSQFLKVSELLAKAQEEHLALQIERDDLGRLMHPIRRCPDEILREIFELTVADMAATRMKQSVHLSNVCQRWRSVALSTPGLWSRIFFDLAKPSESQRLLRACILPRVSQAQAIVTTYLISSNSTYELMECGLQDIPVIEQLILVVSKPDDVRYIFRPSFRPPVGTLKSLCISSKSPPDAQFNNTNCDVLSLVTRFPPFYTLEIRDLPNPLFPVAVTNPNITQLHIFGSEQLDILSMLQCFPRLRHMNISKTVLVADNMDSTYHIPSMESIRLVDTTGETWMERVFFPKLTTVFCAAGSEALRGFLSRHPSITELGSVLQGDVVIDIATVAEQLEKLHIAPPLESFCRLLESSSQIPFPSLKSLTITACCPPNGVSALTPPSNLTLEEFEAVVRALCLPTGHPRSRTQRSSVVSVFAIVTTDLAATGGHHGWLESVLYEESTKVYKNDPRRVYLSWPESE